MIRMYGPEHPETLKQRNNLAAFYYDIGRLEDAERMHREVLEIRSRTLGPEHAETLFSINNLGNVLKDEGRLDEAEALIRQALEARTRTLGPAHSDTLNSMASLALILGGQRKFRDTADMYGLIARGMAQIKSEKDPDLGLYFYNWAASLQNADDESAAETAYREVLRLHVTSGGDDRPYMAAALNGMAKCLLAQKKYDDANEYFQKGLDMRRRMFSGPSGETAYSLLDYGHGLMTQDRHADAEPLLRESLSMVEAAASGDVIRQTESRCVLGDCLSAMGQFAESETLLLRAQKDMFNGGASGLGASRPDVQKEALENLVRLYERWSEAPDGAAYATDLQRWREELESFKAARSAVPN